MVCGLWFVVCLRDEIRERERGKGSCPRSVRSEHAKFQSSKSPKFLIPISKFQIPGIQDAECLRTRNVFRLPFSVFYSYTFTGYFTIQYHEIGSRSKRRVAFCYQ